MLDKRKEKEAGSDAKKDCGGDVEGFHLVVIVMGSDFGFPGMMMGCG
jgi:hypothetical protein